MLSPFNKIKTIQDLKFKNYERIIDSLNLRNNNDSNIIFENRINKLCHKLDAVKSHMNNFINHQLEIEKKCRQEYTNSRIDFEDLDPVFIYETESFLFQTQSALVIVGQIIGLTIRGSFI